LPRYDKAIVDFSDGYISWWSGFWSYTKKSRIRIIIIIIIIIEHTTTTGKQRSHTKASALRSTERMVDDKNKVT